MHARLLTVRRSAGSMPLQQLHACLLDDCRLSLVSGRSLPASLCSRCAVGDGGLALSSLYHLLLLSSQMFRIALFMLSISVRNASGERGSLDTLCLCVRVTHPVYLDAFSDAIVTLTLRQRCMGGHM